MAFLWFNCFKVKLERVIFSIVREVLSNRKIKVISILVKKILLIEYLPIYVNCSYTCIFYLELLSDWLIIGHYSWHWKSRWDSFVVQSYLVKRNDNGASRYRDADWEFYRW